MTINNSILDSGRGAHLTMAHRLWAKLLSPDDLAIDATCGNGHDALYLASLVPRGRLIALDIQPQALEKTRALLVGHLDLTRSIELKLHSHAELSKLSLPSPPKLVVYNLGYLPGGDKALTTRTESTLQSLFQALELVAPGGAISITCYPGHPEGAKEQAALLDLLPISNLTNWEIEHYTCTGRPSAPSLLFLKNNVN